MFQEIGDFNYMLHLELTLSLHIQIYINVNKFSSLNIVLSDSKTLYIYFTNGNEPNIG